MEPDKRSSLAGVWLSQKQSDRLQSIWEHPLWDFQLSPDVWLGLKVDYERRYGGRGATDSTSEDEVDEQIDRETTDEDGQTDPEEDEEDFELDAEESSEEDQVDDVSQTDLSLHEPNLSNRSSEMHAAAAAELLELLFELCVAFMMEEFRDGQPGSSILVYYSGVLALQGNRETFWTAKLFTPILSRLIYI
jgi:hypothetical protein